MVPSNSGRGENVMGTLACETLTFNAENVLEIYPHVVPRTRAHVPTAPALPCLTLPLKSGLKVKSDLTKEFKRGNFVSFRLLC